MPREWEIVLGILFFVCGTYLLWCAYDNRGKRMMWPFSGLMPT